MVILQLATLLTKLAYLFTFFDNFVVLCDTVIAKVASVQFVPLLSYTPKTLVAITFLLAIELAM